MIRIVVADDQGILRDALRAILDAQPDFTVVGTAVSGAAAATLARDASADLVLMDLRMPDSDGLDGLRRLRRAGAGTHVLILTTYADEEAARMALAEGADGYILKDVPFETLADGIRAVMRGHALIDPELAARVMGRRDTVGGEALTPREAEILGLVAEGFTNREIAARLYLTEGTVKNHLSHVYAKVSARSRTEALRRARERGLLDDRPL